MECKLIDYGSSVRDTPIFAITKNHHSRLFILKHFWKLHFSIQPFWSLEKNFPHAKMSSLVKMVKIIS